MPNPTAPHPRDTTRVVVTGLGAVSAYGSGVDALWEGLLAGRSTAARIERFDPSAYEVQIACEMRGFTATEHLPRKLVRQLDPFAQYALVASAEALVSAGLVAEAPADALHAGIIDGIDRTRVGAVLASGIGGLHEMTDQYERLLESGPNKVRPFLAIALPLNMGGGQVAIRHGIQGPVYSVVSACASGTDAIGSAVDLIRAGRADVVVAGGSEAAINPLTIAGFGAAGALSTRNDDPEGASRPFDTGRDGFVAGEGAGVLVLERADHAEARGAVPICEVAGYAATDDANHPTQPAPGGAGGVRAIRLALADAQLDASEIDHVNAHGTSTPVNDPAEAAALREIFGDRVDNLAVTSTKSMIGHLLGAAGGVEAVVTALSIRDGLVHPTINLENQDPECDIDVVTGEPRKVDIGAALSQSFGFGGHNGVLAFRAMR